MSSPLSRRRFLTIAACAAAAPTFAGADSAQWRGVALGSGATMRLENVDSRVAQRTFVSVEDEIRRLEKIFSLFEPDSTVSRLNRDGFVGHPPAELLEVLSLVDRLHIASSGAFDPTIQPLWAARAACARTVGCATSTGETDALAHVGWAGVSFDPTRVQFSHPDMALTLNGVAQGYITDRVRALLLAQGMRDILIDIGEVAANGTKVDGSEWVAGVSHPDGTILRNVTLRDRALATSAPTGTVLDADGRIGHIIDPRNGRTASHHAVVSVSADSAAVADGLSTACCMLSRDEVEAATAAFPTAKLEVLG